ncbi:MAG TPA: hypothetical protein VEQ60_30865 [Longimicrobium sp.]|nr:hypothetical protein [Longimicrobium sp.]
MRLLLPLLRGLGAAGCTLAAACGFDGVTAPALLTAGEVQGTYLVCELRFTPSQGALPPADVLGAVMVADPPPPLAPPSLTLGGAAPGFELAYTRRRDGTTQRLHGEVEFGTGSVFLYVGSGGPSVVPFEALLPPWHLDLVFHAATGRLTAGEEVSAYSVHRRDYAAATGVDEDGLRDRISGHVTAVFARNGCG